MIILIVACVYVALALRLRLKKIEEPLLVFAGYSLISMPLFFRFLHKIINCVIKEEEFENLED
jgi:hypothetical protein